MRFYLNFGIAAENMVVTGSTKYSKWSSVILWDGIFIHELYIWKSLNVSLFSPFESEEIRQFEYFFW